MSSQLLRWVLCCAVAVACFLSTTLLYDRGDENSRVRRSTNGKIDDWLLQHAKHPSDLNLWMKYVKMMAKLNNQSNCYVCSVMPKSSHQPTLYGKPMTMGDGTCFLFMTNYGYNPKKMNYTQFTQCNKVTGNFPPEGYNTTGYPTPVNVIMPKNVQHPVCVRRQCTGMETQLGNTTNCRQVNHTNNCTSLDVAVLGKDDASQFKIDGAWWLCGQLAYPSLPANWSGQCAPIFISDHTVFIHLQHLKEHHSRRKREAGEQNPPLDFKPHDAVWGTDVPEEYKHWTTGEKVALALFPWTGVAKNILRLETVDYRLKTFVNLSLDINAGQNQELEALRLMVLQNRLVLDMLTAERGGVCVLIGSACCSFIPGDNKTHLDSAMEALRRLQGAMSKDGTPQQWNFLSWFTSGPWWHWLLKILTPLIVILISFCLFTTCMIPCLKSLVNKLMANTLLQYQMLQTEDSPDACTTV